MRQIADEPEADEQGAGRADSSRGGRLLWGLVFAIAALLFVVIATVTSVAILVPDALSGDCIRPQLVRPESCAPFLPENLGQ